MTYTVKIAPDTVGFNENGNKLKLRDSSFKNVYENANRKVVTNAIPNVETSNTVTSNVEVPKPVVPSISSKTIKNGEGLLGATISSSGRKPVKIKPAVVEAVKRTGQSVFISLPKEEEIAELTQEIPVVTKESLAQTSSIVTPIVKEIAQPEIQEQKNKEVEDDSIIESPTIDMTAVKEEIESVEPEAELPEEPTISIPVDQILKASNKQKEEAIIEDVVKEEKPVVKPESKIVNLDEVRQMQEKLDEIGKATIEAKQRVVETKNKINDVRQSTESEKASLEKLSKDQAAAEQRSEVLKQKTCEFLEQQMSVLEKKKTAYFEQLSDYEVTLEQAKEEQKKIEEEKIRREKEVQRAQEDYEAWNELHNAITNRAAEFDTQLNIDDASKIVSFRDLTSEKTNDVNNTNDFIKDTSPVKRLA